MESDWMIFFLFIAFFKGAAGCDRHERESVVGPFWLEDLWAASGIGFKLIAIEFSEGRIFWLLSLMGVFLGKWLSELFFNTGNWRWAALRKNVLTWVDALFRRIKNSNLSIKYGLSFVGERCMSKKWNKVSKINKEHLRCLFSKPNVSFVSKFPVKHRY